MYWTIGVLGFDSRWGLGIFLFTIASRLALGPTQLPTKWVLADLSLGIKRLGHEADHSPPSSFEINECVELYFHFPHTTSWGDAQFKKKAQGQLYLYFNNWTAQVLKLIVLCTEVILTSYHTHYRSYDYS
jgi:hypothetical protein